MQGNNYYKIGSHNVICDICQRKRKNDQVRMQWDGLVACSDTCWNPRHPSTIPLPIVIDGLPVQNARPRLEPRFITIEALNTWLVQQNLQGNFDSYSWNAANFYWNDGSVDQVTYDPDNYWPL